jgi:integration host factor subunit alpha
MVLTKLDLTKKLIKAMPTLERNAAVVLVEEFFEEIRSALESGDDVKLAGFGNFELRDKKQRPGRNPRTGEVIPVSARRVVTFHPSQKLQAQIIENNGQQK